ncbi:MAG: cytidine deaminase [Bacteroidota bacterium]
MKQRAFTIRVAEHDRPEDLSSEQFVLVQKAMATAKNAYAPYSAYHVGAAVLLDNGEVITGNNQENAAYPSGLCAERVALFYASSQYPDLPVRSIAIAAMQNGIYQEEPVTPCGGCRQVLYETEVRGGMPLEVILYGSKKIQVISRAADLLPLPFTSL